MDSTESSKSYTPRMLFRVGKPGHFGFLRELTLFNTTHPGSIPSDRNYLNWGMSCHSCSLKKNYNEAI